MNIKQRRLQLNLTMKEVAEQVGVSEATISRWESGDIANMKRSRIVALADALQVNPMEIVNADESQNVDKGEGDLLALFRSMNAEGQEVALNVLRGLVAGGQYKKHNSSVMVEGA